jgi:signal transduction histidine kinase/DNA-binding response OmpR family regulator/HAMP domain-containing protein
MMKQSLKRKIILPSVIVLVILVIFMTAYSTYDFIGFTNSLEDERIVVAANNLKNYLKEYEHHSRAAAVSASLNPNVVRAVKNRDTAGIISVLSPMLDLYSIAYFTVTDETGTVIARTYEPAAYGDSVVFVQNIKDALEGKISTYYETAGLINIAIHTGAPVYDEDGYLAGVISAGVRFDDNDTVDQLKELFGADLTVFLGDMRIATTIRRDGERIEGTYINNDIAKVVLQGKKEYFGKTDIMGEAYSTFYYPLINSKDEAFGILCLGLSNIELVRTTNSIVVNNTIIGLAGLAIAISVLLYIITQIIKPVNKLVTLVSDVRRGNVNVSIDKSIITGDEIGLLSSDIFSLIEVIKSMLGDLSHLTRELNASGGIEFRIDSGKYSGSYKEIIDGIKALGDSISIKNKTMAVMDFLDTMIYVTDFNYNVLYLNQILIETYGIDREKHAGLKCYKVIRNLDEPCQHCRLRELFRKNEAFPYTDYTYTWDEYTRGWIGGKSAIIRWTDGSKVLCNFFKDENQVKDYESQLQDAVQIAQAASVAKSAFLANMSHEIRTPMNSIIGFSELAMDDDISSQTREYLRKIMENAEGLLQIINDILDISKVESGKVELEHIPFDLHEIFTQCKNVIMPKAIEKDLQLYFYTEPSTGKKLVGDPTRLRQILTNLLSNAVKFTKIGTVKLSSSVISTDDNSVTLRFEVRDSGIGMTAEQLLKIYEPFTQADTSTTRKYGGTGLGLSISKNFIELMGGKLNVESIPAVGSKFSFDLTFDTIDIPEEMAIYSTEKIEKPFFDGEILVCEDNAMNQMVIRESLARVGIKAVIAENGQEGINLVRRRIEKGEKLFDLIFMDVQMPVMDGVEAASIIRDMQTGIPIIAMTANIMPDEKEQYAKSGMLESLSKPFTSRELWHCLMKYMTPVVSHKIEKNNQIDNDLEFQGALKLHFVKNNQGKFDEIAAALEEDDIEMARRLTHNLKGNAAQIGKPLLQSAAADVERMLKEGKNSVTEEKMMALKNELAVTLGELSSMYGNAQKRSGADRAFLSKTDNVEELREMLDELESLLKSGNPEVLNFSGKLRDIPGGRLLVQQIEDFEFKFAFSTLIEIKKELGLS